MNTATENKAKLEMIGIALRFVTPLLVTIGLWVMTQINDTLDVIESQVDDNRITGIKLEANQNAFWASFNDYKSVKDERFRKLETDLEDTKNDVDEIETKVNRLLP